MTTFTYQFIIKKIVHIEAENAEEARDILAELDDHEFSSEEYAEEMIDENGDIVFERNII